MNDNIMKGNQHYRGRNLGETDGNPDVSGRVTQDRGGSHHELDFTLERATLVRGF